MKFAGLKKLKHHLLQDNPHTMPPHAWQTNPVATANTTLQLGS